MKRLFVFLATVVFLSTGMVQAQKEFKFSSFKLEKGLVMTDGTQYILAAFTIKEFKDAEVNVELVRINDAETEFIAVRQFGNKTLYLVAVPEAKTKVGETFVMQIHFSYPGGQLRGAAVGSTDDPGDGGPGNTTNPTLIEIKYP